MTISVLTVEDDATSSPPLQERSATETAKANRSPARVAGMVALHLGLVIASVIGGMWLCHGFFQMGFWFVVGLNVMVLIHEVGHVIAFRRFGVRTTVPTFVPFLGAFVKIKGGPLEDPWQLAVSKLAGPLAGGLAALLSYGLWCATHSEVYWVLALGGFILNTLNLVPADPFDGGAVARAIHPLAVLPGSVLVLGGFGFVMYRTPGDVIGDVTCTLLSLLVVGLTLGYLHDWHAGREHGEPFTLGTRRRVSLAVCYFGLFVGLVGSFLWVAHSGCWLYWP